MNHPQNNAARDSAHSAAVDDLINRVLDLEAEGDAQSASALIESARESHPEVEPRLRTLRAASTALRAPLACPDFTQRVIDACDHEEAGNPVRHASAMNATSPDGGRGEVPTPRSPRGRATPGRRRAARNWTALIALVLGAGVVAVLYSSRPRPAPAIPLATTSRSTHSTLPLAVTPEGPIDAAPMAPLRLGNAHSYDTLAVHTHLPAHRPALLSFSSADASTQPWVFGALATAGEPNHVDGSDPLAGILSADERLLTPPPSLVPTAALLKLAPPAEPRR